MKRTMFWFFLLIGFPLLVACGGGEDGAVTLKDGYPVAERPVSAPSAITWDLQSTPVYDGSGDRVTYGSVTSPVKTYNCVTGKTPCYIPWETIPVGALVVFSVDAQTLPCQATTEILAHMQPVWWKDRDDEWVGGNVPWDDVCPQ